MTSLQVQELLDKVKMYRPYYEGNLGANTFTKLKQDWIKALEKYKFEDVEERLEEFFRDDSNSNKIPNPYQLRDCLIPEKIQEEQSKYKVSCKFCDRWLDGNSIRKHEDRCRSIKYLDKIYTRFNRLLPRKVELYDMSDEEFEKKYYSFLSKIKDLLENEERKRVEEVLKSYEKNGGTLC